MMEWWERNKEAVIGGALTLGVAIVGGIFMSLGSSGRTAGSSDWTPRRPEPEPERETYTPSFGPRPLEEDLHLVWNGSPVTIRL